MKPIIAPSILAADFANLQQEVEMINASEADWVHVDIMDGRFVPNISFGIPVTAAIGRHASKPLDVHLMIESPENYVEDFKKAGAEIITVHIEACRHLHRNLQQLKDIGCRAGVALNPHTPVNQLADLIEDIDLVCLMSVNPGFGGQTFIDSTLDKIRQIRAMISASKGSPYLEVDGGITVKNVASVLKAGANVLVAGSAIFGSSNMSDAIRQLRTADQTVTV